MSRYSVNSDASVVVPEATLWTKAAEFLFDALAQAENTVRDVFERKTRVDAG